MSLAAPMPAVTDFGALSTLKLQARAQDPESMLKAAQQFEALFVQQVLKSSRDASLGEDLLGGGQSDFYRDLFDQQMALHLSTGQGGRGIGLAQVLVRQMMRTQDATAVESPASAPMHPLPARLGTSLRPTDRLAAPDAAALASKRDPSASTPAAAVVRGIVAPPAAAGSPQAFIEQIRPHAEAAAAKLGVPAEAIMAQAALETGWGQHVPRDADGRSSHNYFGIKAHGWDGAVLTRTTHEHLGGRLQKMSAQFRAYESPAAAFADYADFLKANPRYAQALREGREDAGAYARGLQKAGYATDPAYALKLLKLIDRVSTIPAESAPADAKAV